MEDKKINLKDYKIDFIIPSVEEIKNSINVHQYLMEWNEQIEKSKVDKNDTYTVLDFLPNYKFKNLKIASHSNIEDDKITITLKYDDFEKLF